MTIPLFVLELRRSFSYYFAGFYTILLFFAATADAQGEFHSRFFRGESETSNQCCQRLSFVAGGSHSAKEPGKKNEDTPPTAEFEHAVSGEDSTIKNVPNVSKAEPDTSEGAPPRNSILVEEETRIGKDSEHKRESWRPFDMLPRPSYFSADDDTPVPAEDDPAPDPKAGNRFHWKRAIYESMIVQGVQLGYALGVQEKTRRALKGPFFADYWRSVRRIDGWSDGNKFFTNYIAHPMQGAMTGYIFLQNHDRAKKQIFAESKQYWKDRFKAFVWSTAWSTNWELGPISQSSVGNVGLYGNQGYVDLVITPTVGTGWLLSEEAIDRYVIRHLETRSKRMKILARTFLNPVRSVANLLRLKEPWYRDRAYGH